jgi:hypothetical protein
MPSAAVQSYRFFASISAASYSLLYFLPVVFALRMLPTGWRKLSPLSAGLWVVAVLLTLTKLALVGDLQLYQCYGFHINDFVINILLAPGGDDSLSMTGSTSSTALILAVVAISANLVLLLDMGMALRHSLNAVLTPAKYALAAMPGATCLSMPCRLPTLLPMSYRAFKPLLSQHLEKVGAHSPIKVLQLPPPSSTANSAIP